MAGIRGKIRRLLDWATSPTKDATMRDTVFEDCSTFATLPFTTFFPTRFKIEVTRYGLRYISIKKSQKEFFIHADKIARILYGYSSRSGQSMIEVVPKDMHNIRARAAGVNVIDFYECLTPLSEAGVKVDYLTEGFYEPGIGY